MPTKRKVKRENRLRKVDYPSVYQPHNFANNATLFYHGESAEEAVTALKSKKRGDIWDEIADWTEEDWNQFRLAFRIYAIKATFDQAIMSWLKFLTDEELDTVLENFMTENRRIAAVVEGE